MTGCRRSGVGPTDVELFLWLVFRGPFLHDGGAETPFQLTWCSFYLLLEIIFKTMKNVVASGVLDKMLGIQTVEMQVVADPCLQIP